MTTEKIERTWKLLFQLVEELRNFTNVISRRDPCHDITLTQARVISCIFFSASGQARIKDISTELGITPGGISQIVDKLVQTGFVVRCTDPNDRRAVCITLSEEGQRVREEIDSDFTRVLSQLMKNIPAEKSTRFLEVLETMLRELHAEKQKKEKINEKTVVVSS